MSCEYCRSQFESAARVEAERETAYRLQYERPVKHEKDQFAIRELQHRFASALTSDSDKFELNSVW